MAIIDRIHADIWFLSGRGGEYHKEFHFIEIFDGDGMDLPEIHSALHAYLSENASLSLILQDVLPHAFFQAWEVGVAYIGIYEYGSRIPYDKEPSFYEVCKFCGDRDNGVLNVTLHIYPLWN